MNKNNGIMANDGKYTQAEREKDYKELCALLGFGPVAPRFLLDIMLYQISGEYHLVPDYLEKFLASHGVTARENESLNELLERKYTRRAMILAHKLV